MKKGPLDPVIWGLFHKTTLRIQGMKVENPVIWGLFHKTTLRIQGMKVENPVIWGLFHKTTLRIQGMKVENPVIWGLFHKTTLRIQGMKVENPVIWGLFHIVTMIRSRILSLNKQYDSWKVSGTPGFLDHGSRRGNRCRISRISDVFSARHRNVPSLLHRDGRLGWKGHCVPLISPTFSKSHLR